MPLNQRDQKRVILHVRARAFEDAARELRSFAKTGMDLVDVDTVALTWERRARQLREDADSTFSSLDGQTVDEIVQTYAPDARYARHGGTSRT